MTKSLKKCLTVIMFTYDKEKINYGLSIQPQGFYQNWNNSEDIMDIRSIIINEHENFYSN